MLGVVFFASWCEVISVEEAVVVVVVVVVVVNFIKHQNRAITGERVAARAAPSLYIVAGIPRHL